MNLAVTIILVRGHLVDEITPIQLRHRIPCRIFGAVTSGGDGLYGRIATFFLPGAGDEVAIHRQLDGRQAVVENCVAHFEIVLAEEF